MQMTKWPWRTTFFYKTSCIEKDTQIWTVQSGRSQQIGAGSQLWGTGSVFRGSGSQTKGARSQIWWHPPNLTPGCWLNTQLREYIRLEPTLDEMPLVRVCFRNGGFQDRHDGHVPRHDSQVGDRRSVGKEAAGSGVHTATCRGRSTRCTGQAPGQPEERYCAVITQYWLLLLNSN